MAQTLPTTTFDPLFLKYWQSDGQRNQLKPCASTAMVAIVTDAAAMHGTSFRATSTGLVATHGRNVQQGALTLARDVCVCLQYFSIPPPPPTAYAQ